MFPILNFWKVKVLFILGQFGYKWINALKCTNSFCIIEFDMMNFFPMQNFKKIQEHLIFRDDLDLLGQKC